LKNTAQQSAHATTSQWLKAKPTKGIEKMKTPQIKPDWETGIYIGNGVVATPTNNYQALVTALKLAVTAPTDEQAQDCIEMAEGFASSLSIDEIERAKKEAS
jgi:hypothetical protein